MVKSIFLQDGEEIFVDDEDYERVSQHTWHKVFVRNSRQIRTLLNKRIISLENFLRKDGFQKVKNNNFTKENLTTKGNAARWKKAQYNNSSKYKGVSWNEKQNKWLSRISVEGKDKHLGYYINEDDAARVYNQAVLDYWDGEGYLNIIGEDNRKKQRDYKTCKKTKKRGAQVKYRGLGLLKDKYIRASISYGGTKHIGNFPTTHHAALAYNKCAIYLHGDDAILNDVPITDELKGFISNWEIPQKILELKK